MPEKQTITPKDSISVQETASELTIRIQCRKPVRCNLAGFVIFAALILLLPLALLLFSELIDTYLVMKPLLAWLLSAFAMIYVIIVAIRHSLSAEVYRLRSQSVEYFRDFHFFRGKIKRLSGKDLHACFERVGPCLPNKAMEDFVPGHLLMHAASGKITSRAIFDYKELEPLIKKAEAWFGQFRH